MTLRIRASGLSDVGRNRAINEDAFAIDPPAGLYLVADGMGGHGHGDVASRLAVGTILETVRSDRTPNSRWWQQRGGARSNGRRLLGRALTLANDRLLQAVEEERSLTGMGTTVVALLVDGSRCVLAHVGDSRAYLLRGGRLEQLTEDHTWVAEQVTAGNLSEDQALVHPFKSVVTRALGGDRDVAVESLELGVVAGDLILLCTDGLTGMVSDREIERHLSSFDSLDALCRRLIAEANRGGGRDNITALVVEATVGTATAH